MSISRTCCDGFRVDLETLISGTREEDVLFAHHITGHYRWLPG